MLQRRLRYILKNTRIKLIGQILGVDTPQGTNCYDFVSLLVSVELLPCLDVWIFGKALLQGDDTLDSRTEHPHHIHTFAGQVELLAGIIDEIKGHRELGLDHRSIESFGIAEDHFDILPFGGHNFTIRAMIDEIISLCFIRFTQQQIRRVNAVNGAVCGNAVRFANQGDRCSF